jgi:hypothetical protein
MQKSAPAPGSPATPPRAKPLAAGSEERVPLVVGDLEKQKY